MQGHTILGLWSFVSTLVARISKDIGFLAMQQPVLLYAEVPLVFLLGRAWAENSVAFTAAPDFSRSPL